jgi:hypothetical protein
LHQLLFLIMKIQLQQVMRQVAPTQDPRMRLMLQQQRVMAQNAIIPPQQQKQVIFNQGLRHPAQQLGPRPVMNPYEPIVQQNQQGEPLMTYLTTQQINISFYFNKLAPVMQQQRPMMRKLSTAEEIELNAAAPSVPQGPRLMRQLSANANMGDHQPVNPQMRARNGMFTDLN